MKTLKIDELHEDEFLSFSVLDSLEHLIVTDFILMTTKALRTSAFPNLKSVKVEDKATNSLIYCQLRDAKEVGNFGRLLMAELADQPNNDETRFHLNAFIAKEKFHGENPGRNNFQ